MKLSECKIGVVVYQKSNNHYDMKEIGMIVGVSENSTKEAIPLVQWQGGGDIPNPPC